MGKWVPIHKGDTGYSVSDFVCSECGKPCPCYHLTPFCPNCGEENSSVAKSQMTLFEGE